MEVLQWFDENNFPLRKYIIDVQTEVVRVSYLGEPAEDSWTAADVFGLDESQVEAFRAAVTKELVIIQGPPGNLNFDFRIRRIWN